MRVRLAFRKVGWIVWCSLHSIKVYLIWPTNEFTEDFSLFLLAHINHVSIPEELSGPVYQRMSWTQLCESDSSTECNSESKKLTCSSQIICVQYWMSFHCRSSSTYIHTTIEQSLSIEIVYPGNKAIWSFLILRQSESICSCWGMSNTSQDREDFLFFNLVWL